MDLLHEVADFEKTILSPGNGELPAFSEGSKITFHFETNKVSEQGKECIDDSRKVGKPMEMIIGKQFKMPIWEKILKTMKIGECSQFKVKKTLVDAYPLISKSYHEFAGISKSDKGHCCGMMAFAEGVGHRDLDELIRDPTDLLFQFELVKVEQPGEYTKEAWSMSTEEKRESIPRLKETGNELYKMKQYEAASKNYAEALGLLEQLQMREKPGDDEWKKLDAVKIPILSNYSLCKLAQKDYYPVIEYTTTILGKDQDNVKALYRRAKAYVGTWDLELAKSDFMKVSELDPSFKTTIQKELKNIAILQKQKDEEVKSKLYGKVFGESAS